MLWHGPRKLPWPCAMVSHFILLQWESGKRVMSLKTILKSCVIHWMRRCYTIVTLLSYNNRNQHYQCILSRDGSWALVPNFNPQLELLKRWRAGDQTAWRQTKNNCMVSVFEFPLCFTGGFFIWQLLASIAFHQHWRQDVSLARRSVWVVTAIAIHWW